jgi:NAD+ diphosphatase
MEKGDWAAQPEPGQRLVLLPGSISIARSMLESWAAQG